jgi:hypothetical protein
MKKLLISHVLTISLIINAQIILIIEGHAFNYSPGSWKGIDFGSEWYAGLLLIA